MTPESLLKEKLVILSFKYFWAVIIVTAPKCMKNYVLLNQLTDIKCFPPLIDCQKVLCLNKTKDKVDWKLI